MKCWRPIISQLPNELDWVHLLTSTGYLGSARHHHFLLQRGKLTSAKCLLRRVFGTNLPTSGFTPRSHGSLQVLSPFHASRSHHPSGSTQERALHHRGSR